MNILTHIIYFFLKRKSKVKCPNCNGMGCTFKKPVQWYVVQLCCEQCKGKGYTIKYENKC